MERKASGNEACSQAGPLVEFAFKIATYDDSGGTGRRKQTRNRNLLAAKDGMNRQQIAQVPVEISGQVCQTRPGGTLGTAVAGAAR